MEYHDSFASSSGIKESYKIPISSTWAKALRQQAKILLLPFFREICIKKEGIHSNEFPFFSDLVYDIVLSLSNGNSITIDSAHLAKNISTSFITNLNAEQKEIISFYMHSSRKVVEEVFKEYIENDENLDYDAVEDDIQQGFIIYHKMCHTTDVELISFLMEEVTVLQDIFSTDEMNSWDTTSITSVNEWFSKYLGLPYGVISFFPILEDDYSYWEKKYNMDGKIKVHTDNGLKTVISKRCGTNIVPQGCYYDPGDRQIALTNLLKDSILPLFNRIESAILSHFDLQKDQINYLFSNKIHSFEAINVQDGFNFYFKTLETRGEHNFDAFINIDLSREVENAKQIWGTQVKLDYNYERWMDEEENEEFPVWHIYLQNEKVTIDERLSIEQETNIISSVVGELVECYTLSWESKL